jgi:hypothetical protein
MTAEEIGIARHRNYRAGAHDILTPQLHARNSGLLYDP